MSEGWHGAMDSPPYSPTTDEVIDSDEYYTEEDEYRTPPPPPRYLQKINRVDKPPGVYIVDVLEYDDTVWSQTLVRALAQQLPGLVHTMVATWEDAERQWGSFLFAPVVFIVCPGGDAFRFQGPQSAQAIANEACALLG